MRGLYLGKGRGSVLGVNISTLIEKLEKGEL
jgi:hypothetical protein